MARTKQIRGEKRTLLCSFCGGEGHNIRGCIFSGETGCFFAPDECAMEKTSPSIRKCSGCGESGHYKKKCPDITKLKAPTKKTHNRPRGRTPKDMVWNYETGVWEKQRVVKSPIRKARALPDTHTIIDHHTPVEVVDPLRTTSFYIEDEATFDAQKWGLTPAFQENGCD